MTVIRNMIVCAGIFLGAAIGTGAFPEPARAAPGVSNTFTITQVGPREMGTDFVTATAVSSPMNCATSWAVRVLTSAQNYQAIVATMLTAFSQSKPVHVWVNQCDASDGVNIIIAAWVDR